MRWVGYLALLCTTLLLSACGAVPDDSHAGATPAGIGLPRPVLCPGCWHPTLHTSWQWQLSGTIDQSLDVAMYDVDLFEVPRPVVDALHARGRKVVCYLNAGAWENWRPDAGHFPDAVKGHALADWPGEYWLDIRRLDALRPLIAARLDLCTSKGFDGVEFDNVDGYANESGFPLSAQDQLQYNVFLANAAHQRGLAAALKNDLDQVSALLPYFDWALSEQCYEYHECAALVPFVRAGKAVMEVEYHLAPAQFCPQANASNFNALQKRLDLGTFRVACR
ncbi:MAG: endo alpha-1,4 polygalactosaminidase [Ktedonobacterales bacterium]